MRPSWFIVTLLVWPAAALAQNEHGDHATVERDLNEKGSAAGPATSRDGSGTAWLPDSSPVHAVHLNAGGFRWMVHGQLYGAVSWQGGDTGDREALSTNWIMAMATRPVGDGRLMLRAMLSLEPFTVGDEGYALVGQSGETAGGEPLIDRQHPHDLFMELAAGVRHPVGPLEVELYGGPAAEPALGPVAFPHRVSAMPSPLAPLGHHWLDSTHISYGVVTAGVGTRRVKLEGSWFNGREPDEQREDLDLRGFDSVSARLSAMPTRDLAVQASWAFLDSPETLEPELSVQRITASATYNRPLRGQRNWATTVAWGRNLPDEGPTTDALLAETAYDTGRYGTAFARVEQVDKEAHEMGIDMPMVEEVRVHGLALGHLYEVGDLGDLRPGVGAVASLTHAVDDELAARYGQSTVLGAMVYLTLRPAAAGPMSH